MENNNTILEYDVTQIPAEQNLSYPCNKEGNIFVLSFCLSWLRVETCESFFRSNRISNRIGRTIQN